MPPEDSATGYFIWGADYKAYGSVDLPTLVSWIKDERVLGETWIFLERSGCWEKAEHIPELQMFFHGRKAATMAAPSGESSDTLEAAGLSPAVLRHVKLLAGLNDAQLARFVGVMQVKNLAQGAQLVKQGEQSDAMYVLLEGELRLCAHAEGRDTPLGNIHAGEFFGEIALFDHGPRSADVIAMLDSILLKISAAEFEKFVYEAPDLAAPFLFALAKTLSSRVRAEHHRYRDSISYVRPPGVH